MRLAAIDIGTNSVHMIVVLVRPDLSFEVVDREKAMVRLGAGGLDGHALTADAMAATLSVAACTIFGVLRNSGLGYLAAGCPPVLIEHRGGVSHRCRSALARSTEPPEHQSHVT